MATPVKLPAPLVKLADGQLPVTPALLVTSTLIVQVVALAPAAPMPAPDTAITLLPGTVVTAAAPPTQVDATLGLLATIRPDGKLSVKLMPLTATLPVGLVIVSVTVVTAPLAIWAAANDLVNTGTITGSTRRHWLVMPLIKLVVVTLLGMLVNGAVAALVAAPATHTALLPNGVV